ncbi:MAG TPA: DUF2330 domain-containing protein [Roseiflexaceae bacterium]|nr:DUF2330 domain-containing protein [Roseiflexaceae bacterium]
MRHRLIRWLALVGLGALLAGAQPAVACGCGAFLPRDGSVSIPHERALVRVQDGIEEVTLELSVQGRTSDAALIFPTPTRPTARLGQRGIFEELAELTKPQVRVSYRLIPPFDFGMTSGSAGGAPPPVELLDRQQLGPFDVSTLAARDAGALAAWLDANGYTLAPGTAALLQPYIDQGWTYVAIRLSGDGGAPLSGWLDPIQISFPTDAPVYPMRLSAVAKGPLLVTLYVLADHRMDVSLATERETPFADWVAPADLPAGSALAGLLGERMFLTKFEYTFFSPAMIDSDAALTRAASDEVFRSSITREELLQVGPVPLFYLLLCIVPLALLGGVWALLRRNGRARAPTS